MKMTIPALLAAALIGVMPPAHAARDWDPCPHEDSTSRCIWNAHHRGNGEGHSFKITRKGDHHWISHRKAHRLLNR